MKIYDSHLKTFGDVILLHDSNVDVANVFTVNKLFAV